MMRRVRMLVWMAVWGLVAGCGPTTETASVPGAAATPSSSESGPAATPIEEIPDTPEGTGTISTGNPGVRFRLKDADVLVLTSETPTHSTSNLKKVVAGVLQEVVEAMPTETTSTPAPSDAAVLPRVTQTFSGPAGGLILLLQTAITVDEVPCHLVLVDAATEQSRCVDPAVKTLRPLSNAGTAQGLDAGRKSLQFHDGAVIYLAEDASGVELNLRRVALVGGAIDVLTNHNMLITDFAVTALGTLFLNGVDKVGGAPFFRYLDVTGKIYQITNRRVVHFTLTPDHQVIMSAAKAVLYNPDSDSEIYHGNLLIIPFYAETLGQLADLDLHVYTYGTDESGKTVETKNPLVGFSQGYPVYQFEVDTQGNVYALVKEVPFAPTNLLHIYPGAPHAVETALTDPAHTQKSGALWSSGPGSAITFFHICNDTLYLAGHNASTKHVLLGAPLFNTTVGTDFLGEDDIQVYHFVQVDGLIYFDGLRYKDNTYILGRINVAAGAGYTEISALDATLMGLDFIR